VNPLVRLYPAAWRERYGDELEALLDDDPPTPFDTLDLLLGALDAHLHLRGLGRDSDHRKGIPMTLRLAGSAAIAGGGLWIAMLVTSAVVAATGAAGSGGTAQLIVILVAQVALLVALAGLSAFQAHRYPILVWIAFVVPAAGVLVSLVGIVGMAISHDEVLVAGVSGWYIWMWGMVATIGGAVLFGAVTFWTAALSRTGALVLAAGSVIAIAALATVGLGFVSEDVGPYLLLLGGLVFGAGWIVLGLDALRRDVRPTVDQTA
jgi:hypothetical protein